MKNIVLLSLFFGAVLFFAAFFAERMENVPTEDVEYQLNATTKTIRASNIGIEMRVVSEGLFDVNLFVIRGSGVVFSADDEFYYALTNFHVVDALGEGTPHYTVSLYGFDEPLNAETIVTDAAKDLAIVRFPKSGFDIPLIDIYSRLNTEIEKDEAVLAVGNSSENQQLVSYGHFTAVYQTDDAEQMVIGHSAQLLYGYSGGALTDIDGNLIGINTWGKPDGDNENLAIPLSTIHEFLDFANIYPLFVKP